ncbi:beta-ketoacyl synthase N-terminal-like domain-containing protein [Motilimonas pumila]|uniref:Uncharacterized protein n=1 Tax=Motilimonas pumila TaxID=2303987 RepID=A0A418YIK4_9GAMM|nr:beta-ketoacyl synthase N-terminal-like domain-containing protein [Motilimonas pumila]RJG50439.1 hypothetical protein D1Z90_02875 [Motilimonas pumila]
MNTSAVAITGVGALTPLGISLEQHIQQHQAGHVPLTCHHQLPFKQGVVADFEPKQLIKDKKSIRMLTRQAKLGIASATLAVSDSQIAPAVLAANGEQHGIIFGAFMSQGIINAAAPYLASLDSQGEIDYQALGEHGYRLFPPLWILPRLPNTTGGQISIQYGLKGISYSVINGPSGGAIAMGEAFQSIVDGRSERVLAGASEMDPTIEQQFLLQQQDLLALEHPKTPGLTISEAGVSFWLERADLVSQTPYAYIDAYQNDYLSRILTLTCDEICLQLTQQLKQVLAAANLQPSDIDAIQVTSAGIAQLDEAEAHAIYRVFGADTAIVSSTANTGFTLGAAAATSLFYACLQLKHGYLAPVHLAAQRPLADKLNYVTQCQPSANIQRLLCHHIDYLGNQCSLILSRKPHASHSQKDPRDEQ